MYEWDECLVLSSKQNFSILLSNFPSRNRLFGLILIAFPLSKVPSVSFRFWRLSVSSPTAWELSKWTDLIPNMITLGEFKIQTKCGISFALTHMYVNYGLGASYHTRSYTNKVENGRGKYKTTKVTRHSRRLLSEFSINECECIKAGIEKLSFCNFPNLYYQRRRRKYWQHKYSCF